VIPIEYEDHNQLMNHNHSQIDTEGKVMLKSDYF